jgi:pimeloyl-ACP methyl ester carboxylesterase
VTERVRTRDGELALDRLGPEDAPVVVLLHGGGQTRHSWSGAAEQLARNGYRVLNFDARGHGESDWASDGCYTLDGRAEDLRAILGDARTYALIGASLGGATAIHAVAQGLRPRALVLVDVVPNAERAGIERIRRFMLSAPDGFASLDEAADAVAAYNPERPRPRDAEGLRRNLKLRDDGRLHWHWDPAILGDEKATMRSVLSASSRKLAEVADLRTLLVRGLRSDVVSDATVAAFREMLPSLEVLDVAGAGHMVAGDRNDAFNAAVRIYLEKHMPPLSQAVR